MNLRLFNARLLNLLHQRNSLLAVTVGLLGLNFIQALALWVKDDRVIVVPPDIRQEFWIQKNKVSKTYLEEMALFYADLLLETTPKGAAFRREVILRNTSPESYGRLKAQLMEEEKRVTKENLSTGFQASSMKVNPQDLSVHVTGDLRRYVGEKFISQSRDTYLFEFVYKHGRLFIKSFKLLGGENDHS